MDSKNALYFCGGAVLGVLGTVAFLWIWEERAEDISNKESESKVVSSQTAYANGTELTGVMPKTLDKSSLDGTSFKPEKTVDYTTVVTKLYANNDEYGDIEFSVDANGNIVDDPSRITDSQFQELSDEGYDVKLLTLYSDGILADSSSDEVMSESDTFAALGPNYTVRKLQRIFSLDDGLDELFVRNNRLYTLYEVTIDDRTYKEVTGR